MSALRAESFQPEETPQPEQHAPLEHLDDTVVKSLHSPNYEEVLCGLGAVEEQLAHGAKKAAVDRYIEKDVAPLRKMEAYKKERVTLDSAGELPDILRTMALELPRAASERAMAQADRLQNMLRRMTKGVEAYGDAVRMHRIMVNLHELHEDEYADRRTEAEEERQRVHIDLFKILIEFRTIAYQKIPESVHSTDFSKEAWRAKVDRLFFHADVLSNRQNIREWAILMSIHLKADNLASMDERKKDSGESLVHGRRGEAKGENERV